MQLNRPVSFNASWLKTILIGLALGIVLASLIILLQPFDTYSFTNPNKNWMLLGYGLCIFIPILLLHAIEQFFFYQQQKKWYYINEVLSLSVGILLICLFAFIYNFIIVNKIPISWGNFSDWSISFALPFIPVFLPLWMYLRYTLGKVIIEENQSEKVPDEELSPELILRGNDGEQLSFQLSEFLYALPFHRF